MLKGIISRIVRGEATAKDRIKVTTYSNGFILDDGPFRDYSEPANKLFIEQLRASRIPTELVKKYKGDLDVNLEDKTYFCINISSEEYKEEKKVPKPQPFGGHGTSMGGVQSQPMEVKDLPPPSVDKGKEITRINIRLHTGKTVHMEVNVDAKVQVVYDYVAS